MTKTRSSSNAVGIFFLLIIGVILDSPSSSCFVLGFQTTTTLSSSSSLLSLSQQRRQYTTSSSRTTTRRLRAIELENDVDVKTTTTNTATTISSAATAAAVFPSTSLTSPSSGIIDEGYPSIKNSSNEATTTTNNNNNIPKTMSEAVKVFFLSQPDYGPLMVVASIVSFVVARITTIALAPIDINDVIVFSLSILFWSIQEHWIHEKLLHSKFNWIGKQIHIEHHTKPYYHISIDPAPLLLGWMLCAHIIFKLIFFSSSCQHLALSATIGYALAGLFYEWAHYLVHTKIKFKHGSFWKLVKDNHVRHHLVNSNYWFSFSLPWIDDLFGTNPPVRNVPKIVMTTTNETITTIK